MLLQFLSQHNSSQKSQFHHPCIRLEIPSGFVIRSDEGPHPASLFLPQPSSGSVSITWITRPGFARMRPLPSYSNGLCPFPRRRAKAEVGGQSGGRRGPNLMRRGELPLSPGETGMPPLRHCADMGIRSFRNSAQPLHANCFSPTAPPPLPAPPSRLIPLSRQVGRSSETG